MKALELARILILSAEKYGNVEVEIVGVELLPEPVAAVSRRVDGDTGSTVEALTIVSENQLKSLEG